MHPRIEGELLKIVKAENGYTVVAWDPELPPAKPGQSPCSQQPVKFWRTYIFATPNEVVTFVDAFMEGVARV